MTVSTTKNTITHTGNSITVIFVFPFLFFEDQHLIVRLDGILQILNVDYNVTGAGVIGGGNVIFTAAPGSGEAIVLQRIVPFNQQTDLANFDGTPSDVTETQFDLIVMQTQQTNETVGRTISVPVGTDLASNEIAGVIDTSDKLLTISTVGPTVQDVDAADLATLAAISDDITTVADNDANVTTVAVNIVDVNTTAGSITNVNAVGSNIANVNTVAINITDVNTVSGSIADVTTVAGSISDVTDAAEAFASALKFTFDSSLVIADPGLGDVRFNSATLASVTSIAIDAQTAQAGNPDVSAFIATWDDSTNATTKGQLRFVKGSEPATFVIFDVTVVVDNTGWLQITVSHVDSNGALSASDDLYLSFARTGDAGSVGLSADNDFTGDNTFLGKTAFKDAGELTIASGAITFTGTSHTVDTEGDAATDDLDTVNIGADGDVLTLRAQDTARTVVIKHNTGNILTDDGMDITLDETEKVVTLHFDAELSNWLVLSKPVGGGSGGALIDTQYFTASGTWTAPAGANSIIVTVTAGGGGGGGTNSGSWLGSGGGGAGGSTKETITGFAATETVTIGSGGAGGAAGSNDGASGGTSSFGIFLSATGGGGGRFGQAAAIRGEGGDGGSGSGGDLNIDGGDGDGGTGDANVANVTIGGTGGASIWGGGGRGDNLNTTPGRAGRAFGSGGGGAPDLAVGGAGKAGLVVVISFS